MRACKIRTMKVTAEQLSDLCRGSGVLAHPVFEAACQALDRAEADARALWAVRVLDAWAARYGARWQGGATTDPVNVCSCVLGATGLRLRFERERVHMAPTPDAARLAAATAVFPELPEAVRAELGARP